jgi:ferredoxin
LPRATQKNKENVPGRYYVDERCIGCAICWEIASNHFRSDFAEGCGYVWRQPVSQGEMQLCAEAMEICPVNAIGNDGQG